MILDLPNQDVAKVPVRPTPSTAERFAPTDHEMGVFHAMASQAVNSKMYRGIGDLPGVMVIMLSARELGIPPMQALNGGLNIIQGKVEISARMMNGMIRKCGHQISVKENTETSCTLIGKRSDTGETQESTFTISEAQKAGLVKPGGGWTKWPKDMCYARALSRLARQLFPDVIGMGYVEGEISVVEHERVVHVEDVEIIEQQDKVDELSEYVSKFSEPDQELAMQYLEAVKTHFGWTQEIALKNLLNKTNLLETFSEWKKRGH